ncbi:MAG: response regulator, partial [Planctomycetes bacterium]|nr:response regulator [Planctomycetota bacterium]
MVDMNANILVVDDERDLLELLSLNLSAEGYTITTVETGKEAISAIETERPDLILLDIMLEDISGIQLTGKLKNSPETASIPIILLTAKDTEMDMVVGLSVGADDYVTKPFSTKVLVARIEAVLRRAYPDPTAGHQVLAAGDVRV